ncbi:wax ester/triacylglycerol synthase family O-acyltransferase [Fodinibacter luteus]|uniref:diacylglycerol O-acyltransferase n=2 Tax=Fodinibacter luteus TaxID=552064 RepID=A0ABP8K0Y1_9MICO
MRDTNAFAWYMEQDPLLRSTVVVVLMLGGAPDWDRLTERLERLTRVSPAFRQKVVQPPLRLATPRWVVDPDFDLSWHIRRFEAAQPRTLATVLEFARKTGMAGLDRDRPLWEVTFIEELDGGQTAVVVKLHHSLTDGIGGMDLARLLFDVESDPGDPGPMPEAPQGETLGTVDLVRDALGYGWSRLFDLSREVLTSAPAEAAHAIRHPRRTLTETVTTVQSVARFLQPASDTLSPVMTGRHMAWHYDVLQFPLADILNAAHAAGAKLNDAFLSGVTAGLRMYHERHGEQVDELRVTMPVSIRKDGDPIGGNRITLMRFKVPVSITDPGERMRETHDRCEPMKADRSLPFTDLLAGALNLLPRAYVGGMLKHIDFLASNVPGIPVPLYLSGAPVDGFYAFGPTIGAALNITLMSYCDTCFVGINTDTGAVPDPDVLMECMRDGFDEVLSVAGRAGHAVLPNGAS